MLKARFKVSKALRQRETSNEHMNVSFYVSLWGRIFAANVRTRFEFPYIGNTPIFI